jgi:hypothetical protein
LGHLVQAQSAESYHVLGVLTNSPPESKLGIWK